MSLLRIFDQNGFVSSFETTNGDYFRSGILNAHGEDTGVDPFMASFPHLLDIGIMGHCTHGLEGRCQQAGTQCYQMGASVKQPNMTLEDYSKIIQQCRGKVYQVALGGRGDPDMHESFHEILSLTREADIVPNLTTSGYGLTSDNADAIAAYCGAAAVSYYKTTYMERAIDMLASRGVTTNLHFVLGNNSIDEAIRMLSTNTIPPGIDRVVFLLHKPVGYGTLERVLQKNDPRVPQFFHLLTQPDIASKTGFDSCCVPGIVTFAKDVSPETFDSCESGRFSAYIGPDLVMRPCSFDQTGSYDVDLKQHGIQEGWFGQAFDSFRRHAMTACPDCTDRSMCMGGCPICPEINLCHNIKPDIRRSAQ
ncbi:radical SAM protein [Alkalibacter rhizosphaerae]|uniref:Radical SAM protein n=1 Tax=Alkalibacter rhizosphaerae TaxID=2815577 RepID=A0A974XDH9_9FIRM|nr:radical SAM protein [Alkalibacter rhizosphaerae]QSX07847.1 radical SAM protein [Alkalibacter rhizosphaerae]